MSEFLKSKSDTTQPVIQPLKHYEMWANYDKMISNSTLNCDDIADLNIELGIVIRDAIRKKKQENSWNAGIVQLRSNDIQKKRKHRNQFIEK